MQDFFKSISVDIKVNPRLLHKKQSYLTSTLADLCLTDNNMKNNNKGHHLTT